MLMPGNLESTQRHWVVKTKPCSLSQWTLHVIVPSPNGYKSVKYDPQLLLKQIKSFILLPPSIWRHGKETLQLVNNLMN